MVKHLLLSLVLMTIIACNKYNNFDHLYYQQQYHEAYTVLKNNNSSTSIPYKEREVRVLLFLAIQETSTYLPLLKEALKNTDNSELDNIYNLANAWINFINAETKDDYQEIHMLVPKSPFKDKKIEHLRLLIQTHALLHLHQPQEAIAYLQASKLTKKSSDLLYIKAVAHQELHQYTSAKSEFLSLSKITTNPKLQAVAYYYLGNIAQIENHVEKAEKYYLKSWDLDPYNAYLNSQLGKLFQKKSYNDLHYRFYRASLRLNENLAESWYRLNI